MVVDLLLTLFLVLLNGFFVAAEFAIVKVRPSQLEMLIKEGNSMAKLSKKIVDHLDAYLSATQLGITLASLALGWIGETVVSSLIIKSFHLAGFDLDEAVAHSIALPISFALITVLHIVFGELAPKSLAIQKPESVTVAVALPLEAFYQVFKPFIWILNKIAGLSLKMIGIQPTKGESVHSPEELRYLVQQSKDEGGMDAHYYDIIKNAFEFPDITANLIMIPRSRVVAISATLEGDQMIETIVNAGFSRIPVYEGSIDHVIGIVYVKDIMPIMKNGAHVHIKDIVRPVVLVSLYQSISSILRQFQLNHTQLAVVINEFGETQGIITLEDIIEELVGDIQDEDDNEKPVVEKLNADTFKIIASSSIIDINKHLPRPLPVSKEYDSLAGLLIEIFKYLPAKGEKIVYEDYEFQVLKTSLRTIETVQVRNLSSSSPEQTEKKE